MENIDSAFLLFKDIVDQIKKIENGIVTEQDTRLKVIDRILIEVLGYSQADIQTEERAGQGFVDYKISISEVPRLLVEAKKEAIDFDIEQSYSGRAFKLNGPVFREGVVQSGIEQAIYYSAHKGIELACLTNGRSWIIFRANRLGDGKDVLSGKAFVFSTLEGILNNFKLFYELLAPSEIRDLKYRAHFQEVEGIQIRQRSFYQAIREEHAITPIVKENYSHDFDRIMSEFFTRLNGDMDPDMLRECFVETKESQIAERELLKISDELVSKIKPLETEEGGKLREVIERVKNTNRHEFVVIVGGKGAGKSTFIDRFFKDILTPNLREASILIRINLAESTGNSNAITEWLNYTLLEECERVLFNGVPTYDELQGIFYFEYDRLRTGNWKGLYETNKDQFKIDFGKHIEERREKRPNEYIKRLIGDITKSRHKVPCIVFDNADHFGIDFQNAVFQYARSIYEKEICLIIVPITEKTSWQLSKQGAIQSFENETLFLPTPSPRKIVEKRIDFIEKKLIGHNTQEGDSVKYFLERGIKLDIKNVAKFVKFLQAVFLKDDLVAKWIGHLANLDIRRCLDLTRDIIGSPHLSMDDFFKAYILKSENKSIAIKPYKIIAAIIKRHYISYPVGQHAYVQNLFYLAGDFDTSPLLSLRILQTLFDKRSDSSSEDAFMTIDQLSDYFSSMGIERNITQKHLEVLLKKGLIYSYDPTIISIYESKKVEIAPSGVQHYAWGMNEENYLYLMLEVTPICDRLLFDFFESKYYVWNYRSDVLQKFLEYLDFEDRKYCHIPDHKAYINQKSLTLKLERRRERIKGWKNAK